MKWRGASRNKPRELCASPLPPFTPCSTAWNSAAGFAVVGKPAIAAAAAAAIALLPPERKSFRRFARNGRSSSKLCGGSGRRPMPDWLALVRSQLDGLALEPHERAEVIEELAAHLDETFEGLRQRGFTEEHAAQRCLREVKDWQDLRRRIQTARSQENIMTNRVKQFWLPALLTLLLSMSLLMLIQVFGPNPWLLARKSGWSLIAPVAVIYIPWLLSLPLIGAIGAYRSNRAGGSQRAVFSSIAFPVLPYLVFFLVALPVIAILNDRVAHNIMFASLFIGLFACVLAPGAALLAGCFLIQLLYARRLTSRRVVST